MKTTRIATIALLLGAWISLFYSTDHTGLAWGAFNSAALKYLPSAFAVAAVGLLFLGGRARWPNQNWTPLLLLFGLFTIVIGGSLFAIMERGQTLQTSFLGRGLNMTALFAAFLVFADPKERAFFTRCFAPVAFATAVIIAGILCLYRLGLVERGFREVFHMDVIFLTAMAAAALVTWRSLPLRLAFVAFALLGVASSGKTTGYLMGVLIVLLTYAILAEKTSLKLRLKRGWDRTRLAFGGLQVLAIGTACLVAALGAKLLILDRLESRSNEVRSKLYQLRWEQFTESPIIGNFFTDSPILSVAWLNIPSHSNHLDILASGGLVAYAFFLIPLLAIVGMVVKARRRIIEARDWGQAYFPTIVVASAIIMIANPLWEIPRLAFVFWLSVGFVLAGAAKGRTAPVPQGGLRLVHSRPEPARARIWRPAQVTPPPVSLPAFNPKRIAVLGNVYRGALPTARAGGCRVTRPVILDHRGNPMRRPGERGPAPIPALIV